MAPQGRQKWDLTMKLTLIGYSNHRVGGWGVGDFSKHLSVLSRFKSPKRNLAHCHIQFRSDTFAVQDNYFRVSIHTGAVFFHPQQFYLFIFVISAAARHCFVEIELFISLFSEWIRAQISTFIVSSSITFLRLFVFWFSSDHLQPWEL